nr:MAG TPA: hypothetical protein [Caudoviricetes sp.]DAV75177.1 MAG TPA: hypothetical protein [Caudoviricetes sp.]
MRTTLQLNLSLLFGTCCSLARKMLADLIRPAWFNSLCFVD